jgi:hypothetical protein
VARGNFSPLEIALTLRSAESRASGTLLHGSLRRGAAGQDRAIGRTGGRRMWRSRPAAIPALR